MVKIIRHALALVRRGWIQNAFALDRYSKTVAPESKDACYWCLIGAITASVFREFPRREDLTKNVEMNSEIRIIISKAIIESKKPKSFLPRPPECFIPESFNDYPETTKDDVVRVLKIALKLAKEQAA